MAAFRTRAPDRSARRRHQRQPRRRSTSQERRYDRGDRAAARGARGRALQRHGGRTTSAWRSTRGGQAAEGQQADGAVPGAAIDRLRRHLRHRLPRTGALRRGDRRRPAPSRIWSIAAPSRRDVHRRRRSPAPRRAARSAAASPFGRRFAARRSRRPTASRAIAAGLGGGLTLARRRRRRRPRSVRRPRAAGQRLLRNDGGTFTRRDERLGARALVRRTPCRSAASPPTTTTTAVPTICSCCATAAAACITTTAAAIFSDVTRRSRTPAVSVPALAPPRWSTSITTAISIWSSPGWLMSTRTRARAGAGRLIVSARLSRRRRFSCCATTATAPSPTSRASARPRSTTTHADRDRADRLRQPSRHRSAGRQSPTRRRCSSRTSATARSATSPPTSVLPSARSSAATSPRRGRRRQQGRLSGFLLRPARSGGVFAMSDGRGRLHGRRRRPTRRAPRRAAQLVDYDNDGLLDLLTWSADGPRLFRNLGLRWRDVTAAAPVDADASRPSRGAGARCLPLADLDLDGAVDIVTADPAGALCALAQRHR